MAVFAAAAAAAAAVAAVLLLVCRVCLCGLACGLIAPAGGDDQVQLVVAGGVVYVLKLFLDVPSRYLPMAVMPVYGSGSSLTMPMN